MELEQFIYEIFTYESFTYEIFICEISFTYERYVPIAHDDFTYEIFICESTFIYEIFICENNIKNMKSKTPLYVRLFVICKLFLQSQTLTTGKNYISLKIVPIQ